MYWFTVILPPTKSLPKSRLAIVEYLGNIKLTQFNTQDFTHSSNLLKFEVDLNINLSILIEDPCVEALMLLTL